MSAFIELREVSKTFGQVTVVEGLNLNVREGEFLSLLGPSGSGKTTILMMLAGFEDASAGDIILDGKKIDHLPPYRRGMGVVFQSYALFPHMNVAQNVAFPLEMRGVPRAEIKQRVDAALARVQLGHLANRQPDQLSGGQQQRVALTRALVYEPRVILMDEPLGALDKKLREEMQLEIRELHRKLGLTIVFVTHDQSEALTMSDRIAIFDKGKIAQIGTADAVYDNPQNRFVAEFIGETNLIEGTMSGPSTVRLQNGVQIEVRRHDAQPSGQVLVSIRPERLQLGGAEPGNRMNARIDDVVYQGDHLRLHLDAAGLKLVARVERGAALRVVGEDVSVSFSAADCSVFPS
jgi:putative spermidine/putrescine transport system ATP-binding protein